MAPAASTKLTYQDYLELPDDGNRYEIIDGELFVNPSPVPQHQFVSGNLFFAFSLYLREHRAGVVLSAPLDVKLDEDTVVQPDVNVIVGDRRRIIGLKNVQGAPDLVIEILSPGTRRLDEMHKRRAYERSGVAEYWIVDPELELVKIHRRTGSGFERVADISTETGGAITTPLLPGFSMDIAAVFAS
jgi:Uma2 family endonuclease